MASMKVVPVKVKRSKKTLGVLCRCKQKDSGNLINEEGDDQREDSAEDDSVLGDE